jgi:hypothetical protein
MSETLFIAILVLSLHALLLFDRHGRAVDGALASGLFALACLVRSNLLPMILFLPLSLFSRPGANLRARMFGAVIGTAVAGCVLVLPGFYFLATTGRFLPFATNAGLTFYGANNPLADGGWVDVREHPELLEPIPTSVRASAPVFSRAMSSVGVRWIRDNPQAFLRLLPRKLANAWIPGLQKSMTTSKSRLASLVFPLSSGLLLTGAIVGRLKVQPAQRDGILMAVLVTYTLMSLVFYGNPRIGLCCAPILIVYASSLSALPSCFPLCPGP